MLIDGPYAPAVGIDWIRNPTDEMTAAMPKSVLWFIISPKKKPLSKHIR